MNIKISILMGAYNIEHLPTFNQAMQSVLTQTMEDFELIVCDDGSSDATYEKLQLFAQQDSRIILLKNKKNLGLAATLNRCLLQARGDFIARQDVDDISHPQRLELQLAYLERFPELSFLGSSVILFDLRGDWGERRFPERPQSQDFLFTMPFVHGALLFRREALECANGYRVARETRRTEDYDLLMRLYALGLRGGNLEQPLYWFLEDQAAMERRKYCYRIDEVKIRYQGFRRMGLLPIGLPFVIKPLVVGLIPKRLLKTLKEKHQDYKNKKNYS